MKILGIEKLTVDEVNRELKNGAKFVLFQYCVSILVMSFKRSSDIYFVRAGESTVGRRFAWSGISLVAGWWGIPWGPIWTIATVAKNLAGGVDVTSDVLASLNAPAAVPAAPGRRPG